MTANEEVIIAGVRRQKDRIEDLVKHLEGKPKMRHDDIRYADAVLKDVEQGVKKLRKDISHAG